MNLANSPDIASPGQFVSELHQAAVGYAESGIPVFPCKPNSKEPDCEHGFKAATTDRATIDAWWAERPLRNIGTEPEQSGLCAIDIEASGLADWQWLAGEYGPPIKTYTNRTPRGGLHLIFRGSLPSTSRRLKMDVDTRGRGGYVLLPPSIVNGVAYETIDDCDPADLPAWFESLIAAIREHDHTPSKERPPVSLAHWQALIDTLDPDCDRDTWRDVIAASRNMTCPDDLEGSERLDRLDTWSAKSATKYTGRESVKLVWDSMPPKADGIGYGRLLHIAKEAGYSGGPYQPSGAEAFANLKVPTGNARPETTHRSRFAPMHESEMDAQPPATWLIDNIVEEKTICIFVGESGSFKTFIVEDICLSVATGKKCAFGTAPRRTGHVFYAALEGLNNVIGERRKAWREAHHIDGTFDFWGMVAPSLWSQEDQQEFVTAIDATGHRPALIAFETLTTMLDGDENDAKGGAAMSKFGRMLIERYGCAVIIVHHRSDKDGASKTGRGTSSFKGNCDSMIAVEADPAARTVTVSVLKHRSFDMPAKPWHLQGRVSGPALVFGLITPDEVRAAKLARDPYHPSKVAAALKRLGAVDPAKAQPTLTLASELVPPGEYESMEERDTAIRTARNRLMERARKPQDDKQSLWAYAEKAADGNWSWYLPE